MKWHEKCVYAMFVLGLSVAASGLSARTANRESAGLPPAKPEIKIDNFAFSPETLAVPVGTTVEWINRDDIPHTVVSDDRNTFKSKALDTDEKFSFTFTKAGTYPYFCSVHPKMTGKVVVQ